MARSPRTAAAPPTQTSTPVPSTITTRTSRRRQSVTSTAPSTPFTPGPLTPADTTPQFPGFTPCAAGPSKAYTRQSIEQKSHALRSVENAAERTTCPFPGDYGGREKCGVSEEDEADEVLMAVCGACALLGNRALSPEELARISVEKGWIRPPSAAVEPTTPFNASIRNHFKRCEKSTPPRPPLLAKQQLAGSVAEQVLESALHPDAFAGPIRPKGTVYYLAVAGKVKWGNPFVGIDVPKPPPKKPGPKKGMKVKGKEEKVKGKSKVAVIAPTPQPVAPVEHGAGTVPPVKLRLFLNPAGTVKEKVKVGEDEPVVAPEDLAMADTAAVSSIPGVAEPINRRHSPGVSVISKSAPLPPRRILRPNRPYDSSEDSDTSDSEDEHAVDRVPRLYRPHRKAPPAPISISGSPRFPHLNRLPQGSPFKELFFPLPHGSPVLHAPASPHSSPFPTHSLDNTWWSVRTENQLGFDTSSSSSDEEMRDPDWGHTSGILIQADNEEQPIWAAGEEDEAKLKEATDALRVLFPMSTKNDGEKDGQVELNRLMPSDASSIAESTSTAAPPPLRSSDLAHIPLNAYMPNSSPVPSPVMRVPVPLPADTSPTQHLSRFPSALEQDTMEVDDEDQPWLDEAGEGPIRADPDETLSDSEVVSQLGDTASPEHDRRRHTAEWALNAAVSAAFRVKEEIVDYPSPTTTELDDPASISHDVSRASSAETQSPSSGSSDIPDEGEMDYAELVCGPESMTVEDVDGLYHCPAPIERTPQRGRKNRCRPNPSTPHRCSIGSWGKIGVAPPPVPPSAPHPTPVRSTPTRSSRPTRHSSRRRKSSTAHSVLVQPDRQPTPPLIDMSIKTPPPKIEIVEEAIVLDWDETIGTAELEIAMAEAEAKEEERRRALQERAEQKRALLEAYRQRISDSSGQGMGMISPECRWDAHSPLAGDLSTTYWGSSDSLYMTPGSGAMSPMALHSMSQLSLRDMPQSVDPRALHTPMSIEGVMGQDMMFVPGQGQGGIVGGDVVMDGSTDSLSITGSKGPDGSVIVQLPSTLPTDIATCTPTTSTQKTGKPTNNTTGTGGTTDTPSTTPSAGRTQVAPAVPLGNGVSVSVISYIPVYFMEVTGKLGNFRVIRRVDSDFVNITNLLLALDCSVAKHASIIAVLEKRAKDSHTEAVRLREAATIKDSASSTTSTPPTATEDRDSSSPPIQSSAPTPVPEPADPAMCYEEGVTGVYVPLGDAQYLKDKFKGQADNPVWAIVGDDVKIRFRQVIKAPAGSMHSHSFGVNFTAGPREGPTITPPPTASTTGTKLKPTPGAIGKKANMGPAHHRANSTTATGARTAQNGSTNMNATINGKGPLVRSANGNPDECPQAKRRRATVVGTSPMKAMTANKAGATKQAGGAGIGAKPIIQAKPTMSAPGPGNTAAASQQAAKVGPTVAGSTKPQAKPPTMVAPSKPAAPAVTVTPVNGVQVALGAKPVPVPISVPVSTRAIATTSTAPTPTQIKVSGSTNSSSPITPASSVSPVPPSVAIQAKTTNNTPIPTLPISAINSPAPVSGSALIMTKNEPTQPITPTPTAPIAAAAAATASPLTRRSTRASQTGTGEVAKVLA